MIKENWYICALCKRRFSTENEALECEKKHMEFVRGKITRMRFTSDYSFPTHIVFTMPDGKKLRYWFDGRED